MLDTNELKQKYHHKIKEFERNNNIIYPLNKKTYFKINHGNNYYKFFERQGGEFNILCILDDNNDVVGLICGIKKMDENNGYKYWYMCDFKINKDYRNLGLSYKLWNMATKKLAETNYKMYGINMKDNNDKNIFNLALKLDSSFKEGPNLMIYMLNGNDMNKIINILIKYLGENICFVSLNSIKDLILTHNNTKMKIMYLERNADGMKTNLHSVKFLENTTYCFCTPNNTKLYKELIKNNIKTNIIARIIHLNMTDFDWSNIVASHI